MILFVGEQQAGHFVEEVAKDSVIFTGTILHVAETEELILAKPYSHIIIDLRQFIDSPSLIANGIRANTKRLFQWSIYFLCHWLYSL